MEYFGGGYTEGELRDYGLPHSTEWYDQRRADQLAEEEAAQLAGEMEAWRARRILSVTRPRGIKKLIYREEAAGLAAVDLLIWGLLASSAIFLLSSALKRT